MADRPRLLDLFCGAGGASVGYRRAGFDVVGVDIRPQPNYPFEFVEYDAFEYLRGELAGRERGLSRQFAAIHASPPCQAHTSMKVMWNARDDHPDLIAPTRALLQATGLPYVIENVPGAPVSKLTRLCGSSFGLGVEAYDGWRQLRRHRYFETSFPMLSPPCQHEGATIGLYGDHARDQRRVDGKSRGKDFPDRDKLELGRKAMGMPWAQKWREISEAIPPAFTEHVGHQLLAHVRPSVGAGT
jgi:DNA (cytosine-5)-methyltransferase 1